MRSPRLPFAPTACGMSMPGGGLGADESKVWLRGETPPEAVSPVGLEGPVGLLLRVLDTATASGIKTTSSELQTCWGSACMSRGAISKTEKR